MNITLLYIPTTNNNMRSFFFFFLYIYTRSPKNKRFNISSFSMARRIIILGIYKNRIYKAKKKRMSWYIDRNVIIIATTPFLYNIYK